MTAPDLAAVFLRQQLADQPLVKRYANTVTTLVTLGINVLWILISLGVDVPGDVVTGVAVAIQALGVVGVRLTPNGVTEKQVRELESYAGRHRAEG